MLLLCAECSAGDLVLLYKLDDISIQAHSMRSATNNNRWSATLYTISIHALHAECDDTLIFAQHLRSTISIHALHAECDLVWEILATVPETNFNPRTPCGVRLQINANLLKKFPLICITFRFGQTICNIYFHIRN